VASALAVSVSVRPSNEDRPALFVSGSERREEEMKLEVDCYSGRTGDERPVRFRLEDCQYMVEEVLDQWYFRMAMIWSSLNRLFLTTPPLALAGHRKWRSHISAGLFFGGQVTLNDRVSGGIVHLREPKLMLEPGRAGDLLGRNGPHGRCILGSMSLCLRSCHQVISERDASS
jgi:hypothetical protein